MNCGVMAPPVPSLQGQDDRSRAISFQPFVFPVGRCDGMRGLRRVAEGGGEGGGKILGSRRMHVEVRRRFGWLWACG